MEVAELQVFCWVVGVTSSIGLATCKRQGGRLERQAKER